MVDSQFSAANLTAALNKREDHIISEALAAWLNCPLPTLKSIAAEFIQNEELAAAIEKCLNAPKAGQKEDHLCKWFYHWYQIDALETRHFVLRFIPQLIWVYLYNISNHEAPPGVEACLLCIYNQEVVERADMEIIFHPPTLSLPSYLHKSSNSDNSQLHPLPNSSAMLDPPAYTAPGLGPTRNALIPLGQPSSLTENALRQFNKQVRSVPVEKALKPIDLATNANRDVIVRVALHQYNSNISLFSSRSLVAYCKMCKRLVNFGFDFTITPIPLLKSKSFSKKYIEEDLDNLAIDSDEDLDDFDDDFGDELSDSDGEMKPRDTEKGASNSNDEEGITRRKAAKSPQVGTPGTPGTPKRRMQKREASNGSSSSSITSNTSTNKIPVLNLPSYLSSSSSSITPASIPKDAGGPANTTTTTTATTTTQNSNEMKNSAELNNSQTGDGSTPKALPRPPIRVTLTTSCLQEMVTGLTFCIFKESYKEHALKALRKIHLRACFDLMPEIILSANALLYLEFQERSKSAPQPAKTPR